MIATAFNTVLRQVPAWTIYILCAGFVGWQFWLALNQSGQYLVEPIKALEHEYGAMALKLLVAGLAITPLRRFAGLNLMKFRRAIGVSVFFLVLAHLLVWAVLDVRALDRIWADILKRPYITVGMAAFVMLVPLAVTSNNRSVRKLGRKWRELHKLVYPAAILAAIHFIWLVKGFQIEPLIYLAVILGLLALRLPVLNGSKRRASARSRRFTH